MIVNAGSEALAVPSLTLIAMSANVPTFAAAGVPVRRPVVALNVAQLGRFAIANVSVPPSGSLAVGANEYAARRSPSPAASPRSSAASSQGRAPPPRSR